MKVVSAEFIKSAFAEKDWPAGRRAEIAFLGRSNVGKSSLLNSLLQRKALARTSNTPGRTQSLNFFLVNQKFYFVDLPGYGYAKVSKTMRGDWGKMAEDYLSLRQELKLSIQLIDSRHPPQKLDLQLNEWLRHYEKPNLVVATKIDKLSSKELRQNLELIEQTLENTRVLLYSAVTGTGREELWQAINDALKI